MCRSRSPSGTLRFVGLGKRRKSAEPSRDRPIPEGLDLLEAARLAVQRFQASQPWESAGGEVEEIEVVHVAAGSHPDAPGEPGLSMTWHQDSDSYGLVMPQATSTRFPSTSVWPSTNLTGQAQMAHASGSSISRPVLTDAPTCR